MTIPSVPNAVAVENVLRVFETEVVAILARAWNREGSGRLEAEKAAIELAEPLRTLRAELEICSATQRKKGC